MTKPTSHNFDQRALVLFDAYVHGDLDRRGFLLRVQKYLGAGMSAVALLNALQPNFALGQQVSEDDARLQTKNVTIPTPREGSGEISGYLVRPAGATSQRLPAVLVVHENRGLNPHIKDITRRLALAGFIALAPDALTVFGGYPGDEDTARSDFATLDLHQIQQDFIAAAKWLVERVDCNGKLGVIGFCYGGGMVNYLATQLPNLNAGVAYYGSAPNLKDVKRIKAPLLLHFAEKDDRINARWPDYEKALRDTGVVYTAYQYLGTQHAFNNDTTPRYDEKNAQLSWQRSVAFLKRYLG